MPHSLPYKGLKDGRSISQWTHSQSVSKAEPVCEKELASKSVSQWTRSLVKMVVASQSVANKVESSVIE